MEVFWLVVLSTLGVLVALVAARLALLIAQSVSKRRIVDRRLTEAAENLGLSTSTRGGNRQFSGIVDGWRVIVGSTARPGTWLRVQAPAISPCIKIEPEDGLTTLMRNPDLRIGEERFDRTFRIEGSELELFAVSNAITRDLLTRREMVVEAGEVRVPLLGAIDDAALRSALADVAAVAKSLSVQQHELPARLSQNVASKDELTIRWKNLTLLIDRFPKHTLTREACLKALQDRSGELRYEAALFLRSHDALVTLASDRDAGEAVRLRALGHLLESTPAERLASLLESLLSSTSPVIRRAAIEGLGRLHRPSDVKRLVSLIDHSDVSTNVAIAKALGAIGDKEAETALLALLAHDHEETKLEAARALGRVGSVTAVESLLAYTKGFRETELKRVAREAIGHIQWRLGDVQAGGLALAEVSHPEGGLTLTSAGGELALAPNDEKLGEAPASKPKQTQTQGS